MVESNVDLTERVKAGRLRAEKQFVFSLYKDTTWYEDYKIDSKVISNSAVKMYYMVYKAIVSGKNVETIDESVIDLYFGGKPKKARKLFEHHGGWETISDFHELMPTENIEAYHLELARYVIFDRLNTMGLLTEKDLESMSSMPIESIESVLTGRINDVFADVAIGDDKVEDLTEGLDTFLSNADKGITRGLPVNSKLLNAMINGMSLGNITMLGGNSGIGKTYLTLCLTVPTAILEQEPIMIICNEEDKEKWQSELTTWVINNKIARTTEYQGKTFSKSRFHQGRFSREEWELLHKAEEWIKENTKEIDGPLLRFVNLQTFSMAKSIRLIKKYAIQKNIKYFILDTLKLDNDNGSGFVEQAWLQLQQNMVRLFNTIKSTSLNCHVWCTYQLSKAQKTKYLDQTSLGMSKNVADVVSTMLLARNVTEREKAGDAFAVKDQQNREVVLDTEKDYMVMFVEKNRQGETNKQVVFRTDKGLNMLKDVGYTKISQDF